MPQVFEIAVERSRKAQPREYENSYAMLSLKAQIAEHEDWSQVAGDLMDQARALVFKNLGLDGKLEKTSTTPPKTETPDKPKAQEETAEDDGHRERNSLDVPPPSRSTETIDDTRKRLGDMLARDIKEKLPKFTDDEVAILMDDERTTVAKAAKAEMDSRVANRHEPVPDLPDEEEGAKTAATVPDENERQEDSAVSDLPEEEAAADTPKTDTTEDDALSASDIQSFLTNAIQNDGLDVTKAKGVLKEFGASRVRDIKESDLAEFKGRIQAILKATK